MTKAGTGASSILGLWLRSWGSAPDMPTTRAKAGLTAFTRCLATEVARHYITVDTVSLQLIYEFVRHT